jgi:hypothetical protein
MSYPCGRISISIKQRIKMPYYEITITAIIEAESFEEAEMMYRDNEYDVDGHSIVNLDTMEEIPDEVLWGDYDDYSTN